MLLGGLGSALGLQHPQGASSQQGSSSVRWECRHALHMSPVCHLEDRVAPPPGRPPLSWGHNREIWGLYSIFLMRLS